MNLPLLLRRLLLLLACAGVLIITTASLRAADGGHTAPPAAVTGGAHSHGAVAEEAAPPTWLQSFGYSYLTAFLFCLSLALGGLIFVIIHHLFDAAWSVPVLRLAEHLACLFRPLFFLLLPLLALQRVIWPWMTVDPATDHSLNVKRVLLNPISFNVILIGIFGFWNYMAFTFRKFSLAQDKDGAAIWTRKARVRAAWGIFAFALSLTLVIILLMMSLQWQFFSTIYGVYYFAGSLWLTLATLYGLSRYLMTRELAPVIFKRQVHDLGTWFFAFTVFYAYIGFSQYFLIWNAAIPEETFWFVDRERGSWWQVGMLILFGHFFIPFLLLLRIDTKMSLFVMGPLVLWAWLMHYTDMTFNVMPVLWKSGLHVSLWDPLCWFGMSALLAWFFWSDYLRFPKWTQKHPRLREAITHHEIPAAPVAADSH
ncbi:MAG TPA: quinol:cytochrome C oxidoreductase [Verrucomicrobiota bacterium]|nr:quinol:cytochrome C oxidoreductase [Verrucomicrobiota bacterium]